MEAGGSRNWKGENCVILQIDESWHRRERLCPATPDAGHFATYSADGL